MKCELCRYEYIDESLSEEEQTLDYDSIKETGRCLGCIEEYGTDGYPDR